MLKTEIGKTFTDLGDVEMGSNRIKKIKIHNKNGRPWVKLVIGATVWIAILSGCNLENDNYVSYDGWSEEQNQEPEDSNIVNESNENLDEASEKESDGKETEKKKKSEKLSVEQQRDFFMGVLDNLADEDGKVQSLEDSSKYNESIAMSCIKDKIKELTQDGYYITDSDKYQYCLGAYKQWFPKGKNLKRFTSLQKKIQTYHDEMVKLTKLRDEHDDLDSLGDFMDSMHYESFYIQYSIKKGALNSIIGKINKEKKYFYYSNDVKYDSLFGEWTYGESEYLVETDDAFPQSGQYELFGYFSDNTKTIETVNGFEREVPVFVVCSEEEFQEMKNVYSEFRDCNEQLDGLYDKIIDGINNLDKKNDRSAKTDNQK